MKITMWNKSFFVYAGLTVAIIANTMDAAPRSPAQDTRSCCFTGQRNGIRIANTEAGLATNDLFHIVIFIVLFSISIQGTLLGLVAKKLDMIDENGNVMKTFSDYSDEMPVEFVKISIKAGHPWENRRIKDLTSLPDLLLVLILRGEERIIPNGNTVVLAGDKIVLSALSPEENLGICLTEIPIEKDSKWIGKPLSRIKLGEEKLVLVLKRNEKVVIPNGNTVIRENDVLVISQL